jgi:hypothetical protein
MKLYYNQEIQITYYLPPEYRPAKKYFSDQNNSIVVAGGSTLSISPG